MAKKVNNTFEAHLWKNDVKGGAWLLEITVTDDAGNEVTDGSKSPWANASAAKRHAKEYAVEFTPRKSVKWEVNEVAGLDAKGKPTYFKSVMKYKVDA